VKENVICPAKRKQTRKERKKQIPNSKFNYEIKNMQFEGDKR